jgi:hypothetical protein
VCKTTVLVGLEVVGLVGLGLCLRKFIGSRISIRPPAVSSFQIRENPRWRSFVAVATSSAEKVAEDRDATQREQLIHLLEFLEF